MPQHVFNVRQGASSQQALNDTFKSNISLFLFPGHTYDRPFIEKKKQKKRCFLALSIDIFFAHCTVNKSWPPVFTVVFQSGSNKHVPRLTQSKPFSICRLPIICLIYAPWCFKTARHFVSRVTVWTAWDSQSTPYQPLALIRESKHNFTTGCT